MDLKISKLSPTCIEVRGTWKAGTTHEFLLYSDVHYDNPKCVRDLFHKHLSEAKERNAGAISFGDFFCFMQGKYDPRRQKADVLPQHNVANYLDAVIDEAASELVPYKDQLLIFADGNHETSILNRLETDPTGRLVKELAGDTVRAGYHGFIKFMFEHEAGGSVKSFIAYFHHGRWSGVVTKGTLATARYSVMAPDAQLVISGHTHDRWLMEQPRFRLKQNGEMKVEPQIHLKCGTYKEEFLKDGGWAIEKIVMPKSLGGWWLRFDFLNNKMIPSYTMAN